jgi:hypothetical protein
VSPQKGVPFARADAVDSALGARIPFRTNRRSWTNRMDCAGCGTRRSARMTMRSSPPSVRNGCRDQCVCAAEDPRRDRGCDPAAGAAPSRLSAAGPRRRSRIARRGGLAAEGMPGSVATQRSDSAQSFWSPPPACRGTPDAKPECKARGTAAAGRRGSVGSAAGNPLAAAVEDPRRDRGYNPAGGAAPAPAGSADAKPERKARLKAAARLRGSVATGASSSPVGCGSGSPARCGSAEAEPEREARWAAAEGLRGSGRKGGGNPAARPCSLAAGRRRRRGSARRDARLQRDCQDLDRNCQRSASDCRSDSKSRQVVQRCVARGRGAGQFRV